MMLKYNDFRDTGGAPQSASNAESQIVTEE
jgi:hypothetical protein